MQTRTKIRADTREKDAARNAFRIPFARRLFDGRTGFWYNTHVLLMVFVP